MTPLHRAWTDGVIQGLREYAWMEGNIQYVGKPHTYECRPLVEAERLAEAVWGNDGLSPCTVCGERFVNLRTGRRFCGCTAKVEVPQ